MCVSMHTKVLIQTMDFCSAFQEYYSIRLLSVRKFETRNLYLKRKEKKKKKKKDRKEKEKKKEKKKKKGGKKMHAQILMAFYYIIWLTVSAI